MEGEGESDVINLPRSLYFEGISHSLVVLHYYCALYTPSTLVAFLQELW